MQSKLTKEKLEEYMIMLKQGEINVDELSAGLIAVHGTTRVEGEMTPMEFLDYLGVPLDQVEMSDELRVEFKAVQRQKERRDLLKRMLAGYADHPAPEYCPNCDATLVSSLVYPFEGEIHESGYCTPCDKHVPYPKGIWSKWNPTPEDFYKESDTLKKRKHRQLSGRWG